MPMEEFEDTKGVIRIHNGQKKKDKQRSIKHTHKRTDKIYVLLFIQLLHIFINFNPGTTHHAENPVAN
jgi:hypothetical protein